MALSYLRLQGFMKQIGKCTKAVTYLSGQTSRSCSSTRNLQAESSDISDPNLEADSNLGQVIQVSETDLQTGNKKSIFKKKLHQRILTASEIEEGRKWENTSINLKGSDSFGGLWRGKQRDSRSVKYDESSQKKISKLRRKNPAMKMADENLQSKKDGNTFGTLSENRPLMRLLEDVDDKKSFPDDESDTRDDRSHIRLSKVGRYKEPYWYAKQINNLGKEGKVLEAIEMLEGQMLKKDRVMPTTYVFNQLFGILGKVGYTKKAFQLFNKMKKMSIQPDGHTYTCLFNCCSNSPWPQDGLKRTSNLHELLKDKNVYLHPITYKAMVKAYGVCGDIQAAFQAADEMCKIHPPDVQLYSFLLMACVSDTQAGLRHALQVWKLMHKMRIKPDLPLYNLFLRVVRDSGFGTDEEIKKFPKSRNLHSQQITKGRGSQPLHSEVEETDKRFFTEMISSENSVSTNVRESSDVSDVIDAAASLFGSPPVSTSIDLSYPENRLEALGGPLTILEDMKTNGVIPNVLTFTIIVDSLPQDNEVELRFLEYMAAERVERDIDFYNMVIRRRNRRNDYQAAYEVLKYITNDDLFPNLRTFGCLAMGCTTLTRAKELLRGINEAGLEPNVEIFGLLAYKSYLDFEYKEALLGMLKKRNIYPNHVFIKHVEHSIQAARKRILKMERNEDVGAFFKTEKFRNSFEKFMINYPKWLKSIGFDQPEHPWKDFRHATEEEEEEER